MTLENVWRVIDNLNEKANIKVEDMWLRQNAKEAMHCQSQYFIQFLKEMDDDTKKQIIFWINDDAEFEDFLICLAGNNDIINILGKSRV